MVSEHNPRTKATWTTTPPPRPGGGVPLPAAAAAWPLVRASSPRQETAVQTHHGISLTTREFQTPSTQRGLLAELSDVVS